MRALIPDAATAARTVVFLVASFMTTATPPEALAQSKPWDNDPNVQAVLALRARSLDAMMKGNVNADNQRLSSTFVVLMPEGSVVRGADILKRFAAGTMRYDRIDQRIDYAGSHGPDMVVLMGEETVVAGGSGPNAGKPVRRRFTDVFRRENGEWRHDLRHANVIANQ
jgi:hypothetical protein